MEYNREFIKLFDLEVKLFDLEVKMLNFWMILKPYKVEMLLILEEEKIKERILFFTKTLQLLNPPPNPPPNPTIFPIKII